MTADLPLFGCESCGTVSAAPAGWRAEMIVRCPRCGHRLYHRKPMSLQRTWAWLGASAALYVPANLLPITSTADLFGRQSFTISQGIYELWEDGAIGLAVIVFIASIAVPLLKIGALGLLAWSARARPAWRRLDRARLYRIVETVGHWSMLDVYVVVLLAGMIRFGSLASVEAEPGLLAFAGVVVLTMLATRSFDPRLIWHENADA